MFGSTLPSSSIFLGDFPSIPVHVAQNLALLQNAVSQEVSVGTLFRLRVQAVGQPLGENGMFSVVQRLLFEGHALARGRGLGHERAGFRRAVSASRVRQSRKAR